MQNAQQRIKNYYTCEKSGTLGPKLGENIMKWEMENIKKKWLEILEVKLSKLKHREKKDKGRKKSVTTKQY